MEDSARIIVVYVLTDIPAQTVKTNFNVTILGAITMAHVNWT